MKSRSEAPADEEVRLTQQIEVRDVVWQYEGTEKKVLDGINLVIKKGQSAAFIGQSGAGKTTLADIILGLLYPQQGKVLLDGKYDIYQMPAQWSKLIAFVPQTVYLMDDTIRNNVAFGVKRKKKLMTNRFGACWSRRS